MASQQKNQPIESPKLDFHEPEAHNIGNWHWEEKDFTEWAKKTLKEEFTCTKPVNDTIEIELEVDSIKGEVFKYIRKNKLRESYDLTLALKYEFKDAGKDVIRGTIEYEPFCDDEDPENWDFELKVTNKQAYEKDEVSAVERIITRSFLYPFFENWLLKFEKEM